MLTRLHAAEIVALSNYFSAEGATEPDLVSYWGPPGPYTVDKGGVFAPEEVFFATALALLGYLRKPDSKGEIKGRDWVTVTVIIVATNLYCVNAVIFSIVTQPLIKALLCR